MRKVYLVEAYYSGWYLDDVFSSAKKAKKYIEAQEAIFKVTRQVGRMCFRIVPKEIK